MKAFQRAESAPPLPNTPFRFVCYFVAKYRWWYLAMVLLETAHATCGIMVPYAIGEIVKGVTRVQGQSSALLESLRTPLLLFIGLSISEVIFGRAGGTCRITIGPRQRRNVTRHLFAYLQHHSHRYLSNNFAGALAHRISKTSMGVSQTLWAIIFDFWPVAIVFTVSIALLYRAHPSWARSSAFGPCFRGPVLLAGYRCQPYALGAAREKRYHRQSGGLGYQSCKRTIIARLDFERELLDQQLKQGIESGQRSNWYSERVRWFQFCIGAILKVGTLYYSLMLWGGVKSACRSSSCPLAWHC